MFAILHTGADSSSRRVEVFAMNEYYKSRELKPSESMLTATATLVYLFLTIHMASAKSSTI